MSLNRSIVEFTALKEAQDNETKYGLEGGHKLCKLIRCESNK